MFLKTEGFELEIREDAFVCFEEGSTSHFCEWSRLDPALQETFLDLRRQCREVMQRFLNSEKGRLFLGLSETYEDKSNSQCSTPKTERP